VDAPAHYRMALSNMAWESFGGESILIDFVSGSYFSLSQTASEVVNLAAAGHEAGAIAAQVAGRYAVPVESVRSDVLAVLARAVEEGVLAVSDARASIDAVELAPPVGGYAQPTLEKYEDMQEMLLLDPVHGLDEDGWPRAEAASEPPPAVS